MTIGPSRLIHFYAEDPFTPTLNTTFSVPAGDTPPRIVGGYAKWQVIDRPLRRGLTVFQGYDPISMSLSLRFQRFDSHGSWVTTYDAGVGIESQIAALEWVAGEGRLVGPPPFVWLTTYDGHGNTVPLISFLYQSDTPGIPFNYGVGDSTPWIVTGLDWDANPIRNDFGYRVRQEATVTVQYYQPTGSTSPTIGKARPKATRFVARNGADTALLIARREATNNPATLAGLIVKAPQNAGLRLRSVNQLIKHGARVYVPAGA
jgi:hypothetical protein